MSGYHDCPCPDCFEIAIGEESDGSPCMCDECTEHGCDGEDECLSPNAYGGSDSDPEFSP